MNIDTLCPSVRVTMKKAAAEAAYLEALVPGKHSADHVHHAIAGLRMQQGEILAGLIMSVPGRIRSKACTWIREERDRILDEQQLRALQFGY